MAASQPALRYPSPYGGHLKMGKPVIAAKARINGLYSTNPCLLSTPSRQKTAHKYITSDLGRLKRQLTSSSSSSLSITPPSSPRLYDAALLGARQTRRTRHSSVANTVEAQFRRPISYRKRPTSALLSWPPSSNGRSLSCHHNSSRRSPATPVTANAGVSLRFDCQLDGQRNRRRRSPAGCLNSHNTNGTSTSMSSPMSSPSSSASSETNSEADFSDISCTRSSASVSDVSSRTTALASRLPPPPPPPLLLSRTMATSSGSSQAAGAVGSDSKAFQTSQKENAFHGFSGARPFDSLLLRQSSSPTTPLLSANPAFGLSSSLQESDLTHRLCSAYQSELDRYAVSYRRQSELGEKQRLHSSGSKHKHSTSAEKSSASELRRSVRELERKLRSACRANQALHAHNYVLQQSHTAAASVVPQTASPALMQRQVGHEVLWKVFGAKRMLNRQEDDFLTKQRQQTDRPLSRHLCHHSRRTPATTTTATAVADCHPSPNGQSCWTSPLFRCEKLGIKNIQFHVFPFGNRGTSRKVATLAFRCDKNLTVTFQLFVGEKLTHPISYTFSSWDSFSYDFPLIHEDICSDDDSLSVGALILGCSAQ